MGSTSTNSGTVITRFVQMTAINRLLLLTSALLLLSSSTSSQDENITETIRKFFSLPSSTAMVPEELKFISSLWEHGQVDRLSGDERDLACNACEAGVAVLIDLYIIGAYEDQILNALANLCSLLGIINAEVCKGAISNYAPSIKWIVLNSHPTIGARQVCASLIGKGCGAWQEINDWTVKLPSTPKPPVEEPVLPPKGSPSRKILHLTDVHLDLSYMVGAEAKDCGLPMCCGSTAGGAQTPETAAGHWGDYQCDIPVWTAEHMMKHIKKEHGDEIDYIMVTGDYPAHDVWLQSRDGNLQSARTFLSLVKETFPDTQVFPSIGNHEPFPCNSFPGTTSGVNGTEFDPDSFLAEMSEFFTGWLPEEQLESFQHQAGYSILFRPGFRIISVPSPLCLNYNFFSLMDFSDPGNILSWLVDQLLTAEEAGEMVHILSHVPAGNHECLGGWGREYAKIISRFENTVRAQFHGHTHNDHFEVYYDETGTRASNIGWITPSVSTFTNLNPGFRLYEVDSGHPDESYRILDTETFVLDLEAANKLGPDGDPAWSLLYSARTDLELESMFPKDMEKMVRHLANEVDYYGKWLRYYNKAAPGGGEHKWDILCNLLTTSNLDKSKCDEILGPARHF